MKPTTPVKLLLLACGLLGCGSARSVGPAAAVPEAQAAAAPEAPHAADVAVARTRTLVPPTAAELGALRPLLDRGPVFLVKNADGGADARITIITRVRAPAARVHDAITAPADYTTFMPILSSVEMLSTRGARAAFRFHVAAPLFDVTALCAMHDLGDRRVDVAITHSETGPGGSRWDLTPDGERASTVSLTTWGDPSQGHWMLRQVARRSPAAIAGMNISVDTVLALGAARRAEILSGENLPPRPAQGTAPPGPLAPPAAGPWLDLARDATVLSMSLTPEGSVTQVTVAAHTDAAPAAVIERLRNVTEYGSVWGSVREVEVLPTPAGAPTGAVRYRIVTETPLVRLEGEQLLRVDGRTVWQDGLSGDLADSGHRWDVLDAPGGGSWVLFTGGSDQNRAGRITRALMERDPWLMAGFAGSWKIVWLRNLLRSV
ncbi:MAG: hypothetical protein U0324_28925 [Polyangiales bacterium]